jgi:hypothetical protein
LCGWVSKYAVCYMCGGDAGEGRVTQRVRCPGHRQQCGGGGGACTPVQALHKGKGPALPPRAWATHRAGKVLGNLVDQLVLGSRHAFEAEPCPIPLQRVVLRSRRSRNVIAGLESAGQGGGAMQTPLTFSLLRSTFVTRLALRWTGLGPPYICRHHRSSEGGQQLRSPASGCRALVLLRTSSSSSDPDPLLKTFCARAAAGRTGRFLTSMPRTLGSCGTATAARKTPVGLSTMSRRAAAALQAPRPTTQLLVCFLPCPCLPVPEDHSWATCALRLAAAAVEPLLSMPLPGRLRTHLSAESQMVGCCRGGLACC